MAQSVEHVIGNDEVISSNLIISSKIHRNSGGFFVSECTGRRETNADTVVKLQFIGVLYNAET